MVVLAGCGKGGNLATVSGVVTYKGSPVDGAKVEFHGTTESGGKKDIVSVVTDSSGKYVIAGVGRELGLPPGLYKVAISKIEGGDTVRQEGIDAGQMEAVISDTGGKVGKGKVPTNALPKEYALVTTTKLTATLEPGKNENVNFDLKEGGGK